MLAFLRKAGIRDPPRQNSLDGALSGEKSLSAHYFQYKPPFRGHGGINMTGKNKIKVAVLGASGLVGRHLVRLLADHPFFELALVTASTGSSGKKFKEINNHTGSLSGFMAELPERVQSLTLDEFNPEKLLSSGVQIVFSALPSEVAGTIERDLRQKGFAVFSNSPAYRREEDVPIIIPEVNPDHLKIIQSQQRKFGGFIVTSSNCCVAGLALALKPLMGFGLKKINVTTFQSVSGAGREALPAIDIIDNLIPFIKDEEEKISFETAKILGNLLEDKIFPAGLTIHASCVRVPILYGHLLALEIELKTPPDLKEILNIFFHNTGLHTLDLPTAPRHPIIVRPEFDRPQPALDVWAGGHGRKAGMVVTIGRLRLQEKSLRMFLLVNNLVRGAAGNCLLAAELAYELGYLNWEE